MAQTNKEAQVAAKETAKQDSTDDEFARVFDQVLYQDEKILKGIKPHKGKTYFSRIVAFGLPMLVFLATVICLICIPDESGQGGLVGTELVWALVSVSVAFVLCMTLCVVFTYLFYKHTFYVVTNQRIIIRTGIIGVDFKSLELKSIGASDVYVSLLDKILCKNTGSIRFGSASSPMTNANSYAFAHIKNPYELYKQIRALCSEAKGEEQPENKK